MCLDFTLEAGNGELGMVKAVRWVADPPYRLLYNKYVVFYRGKDTGQDGEGESERT